MIVDQLGQEVSVGCKMIFSAGKEVKIYEVLKVKKHPRSSAWDEVFVDVGASKKWKFACDGIKTVVYDKRNNEITCSQISKYDWE